MRTPSIAAICMADLKKIEPVFSLPSLLAPTGASDPSLEVDVVVVVEELPDPLEDELLEEDPEEELSKLEEVVSEWVSKPVLRGLVTGKFTFTPS